CAARAPAPGGRSPPHASAFFHRARAHGSLPSHPAQRSLLPAQRHGACLKMGAQWGQHPMLTFPGADGLCLHLNALSLLNTSANARLFEARGPGDPSCIRCAVVGTGGILNGSGMGATINRHDYVFRMNGAITAGFERDVGDRTSFYGFSTNTMMNALHNYAANGFQQPPRTPETRYLFLPDHDRDYLLLRAAVTRSPVDQGQDKGARPQQYFGEDLRAEKFKMLHPDFIRYLRNRFLLSETVRSLHWKVYRPSTGAVMLLAAMHVCDEVSAYGFLTPNYTAFSEHYYDRVPKSVSFYLNHDMLLELRLWQRLQRSGLLTLYTRG
uniref:alpha-N-acetylgalactosaminide alpha-2,6-sialyltransferase n=1 Tax=Crocodylus porosus TaxID=8502 RepID=A0A7M4FN47_CROPO